MADVGLDRPSRPSSLMSKGSSKKQILRGFKVKASEREGFEREVQKQDRRTYTKTRVVSKDVTDV